jgi:Flp pilus assembly protein CpaB
MTTEDETATRVAQTRDTEHPHERQRMASTRDIAELAAALRRYSDEEREGTMRSNFVRVAAVACFALIWIAFVGAVLGGLLL